MSAFLFINRQVRMKFSGDFTIELFEPLGGQPLRLGDFDDDLRLLVGQELLGLRVDVRIGLQAFQVPLGGVEQLALAELFQKLLHRLLGQGRR